MNNHDEVHVGLKREELRKIKSRLNTLLHCEKEKIRELNDSLLKAKHTLKKADVQKKHITSRHMSDASYEGDMDRYKLQHTRFNTNDGLMEAKQSVLERNRRAHSYVKSTQKELDRKFKRAEAERRIKNMQTIIKTKMYELAAVQNSKNQQLIRKIDTSKRLNNENKKKKQQLTKANFLMNYSLDIENMIKSNIEMAAQLKSHYESLKDAHIGSYNSSNMQEQGEDDDPIEKVYDYGQMSPSEISLGGGKPSDRKKVMVLQQQAHINADHHQYNNPAGRALPKISRNDNQQVDLFMQSTQGRSTKTGGSMRQTNSFNKNDNVPAEEIVISTTQYNRNSKIPPISHHDTTRNSSNKEPSSKKKEQIDDIFAMAVRGK